MPRRPRRNHSPAFKAKVALEAIRGEEPLIQTAERYDVHPNQITKWKRQLLQGAPAVFGENEKATEEGPSVAELNAKIGELTMECAYSTQTDRPIRPHADHRFRSCRSPSERSDAQIGSK